MSDATPYPLPSADSSAGGSCQSDRDLLLGVLAVQLDFISLLDLQRVLQDWSDRSQPLGQVLVEQNLLSSHRRALLEELTGEYLLQYDTDPRRGLLALCEARASVDLTLFTGAVPRSSMATLTASPNTRLGPLTLDAPPIPTDAGGPSRLGSSTSLGKRFRILRPHARGALGQVFVAVDEELNREVALKEIQGPYAHHPDSRARFLLEAEITGGLEHPGIVPVYGLGRHPDGRPYYAMRFIRGESLYEAIQEFHAADVSPTRDATERALALRGLLRRFIDVCNAVSYAHARGVVHRDLKPSNVMLGPYGETLVVDWGLAKPMGVRAQESGDRSQGLGPSLTRPAPDSCPLAPAMAAATQATMLGQAVGTPAYMPPEQAAGRVDEISPRSDIYSLGATLYQLLTGLPPFPGDNTDEVLRLVQAHNFPPPRNVKRQVPAPLEAIVLKAMAFHPAERYASAHELASEVERWLADEPVAAYREPIVEQTRRWMRRHRPLVAGLAALLLTAVVGLAVGLYAVSLEQRATRRERDIAQENLQLARDAVDRCFILATEDPLLQQEKMRQVRRLLLARALPFYQNFRRQNPNDDSLSFEVASNHFKVAVIIGEIGQKEEALESYARAYKAMQDLVKAYPEIDSIRADLARITNNRGVLLRETGRWPEARESLEEARRLRSELVRKFPDKDDYKSDLASTYNNLGVLQRDSNEAQAALDNFEKARDILDKLQKKYKGEPRYQTELASTLLNLGRILASNGETEEAKQIYETARSTLEILAKAHPDVSEYRGLLARTFIHLGRLLQIDAQAEALKLYGRAREMCETLAKELPDVVEYQADLANACDALGQMRRPSNTSEAIQLHRQAVAILERLVKQHPDVPGYRIDLAAACANLGRAVMVAPAPAESLPWYNRAFIELDQLKQRSDAIESRVARRNAHWGRAEALGKLNRHKESVADFDRALELGPPEDRDLIRHDRAFALARAGEVARAVREAEDLVRGKGVNGALLYDMACVLALSAKGQKDARQAEQLSVRSVELLKRAWVGGFFRDLERRKFLQTDPDLKTLHEREDFKELLKQIEAK